MPTFSSGDGLPTAPPEQRRESAQQFQRSEATFDRAVGSARSGDRALELGRLSHRLQALGDDSVAGIVKNVSMVHLAAFLFSL
jgi:hypothetical protein